MKLFYPGGHMKMVSRILTVTYLYTQGNKEVPCIRLQGKWLEELVFEIGSKVEVQQDSSKLIINLLEKQTVKGHLNYEDALY